MATTMGYCSRGSGKVDSDGGGKSKGTVATITGYCGNGGSSNKDNSKGNSGKNGGNAAATTAVAAARAGAGSLITARTTANMATIEEARAMEAARVRAIAVGG